MGSNPGSQVTVLNNDHQPTDFKFSSHSIGALLLIDGIITINNLNFFH